MRKTYSVGLVLVGVLCGVAVARFEVPVRAQSSVIKVELRNASPVEAARELERALGAPVEVQGGAGRTVTISLATGSPVLTLDRVSALLGGTWRMKLRVRAAQPGTAPAPDPRPVLERNLSVGIQDLPAERAFGVVARDLRADLELEGELTKRITLPAANVPVTVLLDRISEQAGAAWSIRYVIQAPDAPPPPEPRERELVVPLPPGSPAPPPAPTPVPPPMPAPVRPAPRPVAPSATSLRQALWADVNHLLRADPGQRSGAVRTFVSTAEQRMAALERLNPAERATRLRAARPVLIHWRRMYQGLAPNVKRELAPAAQFLERHLG